MAQPVMNDDGVTQQEETFCQAFMKCGQKKAAFEAAYDCSNYKVSTINRTALKVFNRPRVQQRIQQLKSQVATELIAHKRAEAQPVRDLLYGAVEVFRHWQDIALADPLKVVTHRRICCRFCHGKDHRYQWRDKEEFAVATAKVMDENAARSKMKPPGKREPLPVDDGGYGFRYNEKPHQQCPRCLGEGFSDVLVHDLDKLGPRERRLVKSVRMKKGDVEVVMHDQADALNNMAKALGMLVEKIKFVDPNAPNELPALPLDPVAASRAYTELMKSGG